ncbi:ABC transporter G family member 22-like isoform X3 [Papaver somniferum]|uniref:ABC transporter G family member 22-like isoform X3 n=1 Tax=Papaver somniferum TaxID=3469 RepID=UPI000E6FAA65|nr:ABC transporter G family member 22-like isoform X3 [Papaver somniferum]
MKMEMASSSTVLPRSKSDQLETMLRKSPSAESATSLARKLRIGSSPGPRTHTRKHSRSGQLDEVSSGGALSRASSASFGFFSSAGFTVPPEEIANLQEISNDDIPEDIEANTRIKIHTEPTLPIYLKFTDLKYKVVLRGVRTIIEKNILNGITGSASPGEVLALMGPSGSGKTTLLNLLSGRLIESASGGSITYNDQQYSKSLKRRIGFVTQDDVLFPHLTVRETLTYAALLRLPKTLTKQHKAQRAVEIICDLGLERCQDTMIGGTFVRGISGGERKRVCIGNEILLNPSLLFLDEPTSGLDSTTALRMVRMLHEIAKAGKTVVTTIHQPSSRLFHKFDKLILLGKGSLLYFGNASEAMVYFSSIGCTPLIAMNPAEFLVDLANGNINDVSVPLELKDKVQMDDSTRETKNGKPSPTVIHEAGLLFFIAVFWGFFPVFTAIFTFPQERAMLNKERAVDMYRLSAYFTARTTSDLPLDLFLPVLFLLIVYFMAGLRLSVAPFVLSMLIVFLSIIAAQGLGLAIGAMLMDVKKATTLASITAMTFMLAGGFFVKRVPAFISWIRYISFNYHTYRLLLKVQYDHIPPALTGIQQDRGFTEITAMLAMVVGYRLLAYISLRNMNLA